ncbi:MAG: SDR family oxidoreductase [Deltaproteobacteria bacterium]|nr:SDR family oxidoreductase [Deltaproteobacteria bacterium]
MEGRIVLVTGATQGIGRETALGLAKAGARVGIVGRDPKRTEDAAAYVKQGAPGAIVDTFVSDLSVLAEVRALGQTVCQTYTKLHVLVNNAGAIFMQREVTKDGLERTFALNHLSYFLLTRELLPLLTASAPARIVNVASTAHRRGTIDWDDLQSERGYSGFPVYGKSKLMNILFTRELARRLDGTGVTANCLHPGVINTGFGRNDKGWFGKLYKLGAPLLTSADKGARTTLHVAMSEEGGRVSGEYFNRSKVARPRAKAQNDADAKRLWDVTEALLASKLK